MKILVDGSGIGKGGVAKICREMLLVWSEETEFFLVGLQKDLIEFPREFEISNRINYSKLNRWNTIFHASLLILKESKKYDVVLCMSPSFSSIFSRVPLVTMVHDFAHIDKPMSLSISKRIYRRISYKAIMRKSISLIFVSDVMRLRMKQIFPSLKAKIIVLAPSGELVGEHVEIPILVRPIKNGKKLIMVPGHASNKGVTNAVEVSKLLDDDFVLVLLTGNVESQPPFEGENDKIIRLQWLSEQQYAWLFRQASVLLMLSEYEGFGMPVRQALYYGLPQVISFDASLFEASESSALRVDPFNTPQVATAIKLAICSDRKRQAEAPLQTWENYVRNLMDFLSKSIG